MQDLKTFRKIVEWMLSTGKSTNTIAKLAGVSLKYYSYLMHDNKAGLNSSNLKARIQDFNKKYYPQYIESLHLDELPEKSEFDTLADDVEVVKEIPVSKEAEIKSMAVNESRENALSEKRKYERAQEKIFHDHLVRLYDVCPDHMSVDVILKRK